MKYLVVILILVLLFLILKNDMAEKFNQNLVSPDVIEVKKNGDTSIVKFRNESKQKKNFIIFYIDVELPEYGIWVEKKIECDQEICDVTLNDMTGKRYHLVVLETNRNMMSPIGKIIKFGDAQDYTPYEITPVYTNENILNPQEPLIATEVEPGEEIFNKEEEEEEEESGTPSPYLECGRNPKVKYVENKSDMNNIDVRSKCSEDEEIPRIQKKVSRSLWNEFKKGYLTVDLNLVN